VAADPGIIIFEVERDVTLARPSTYRFEPSGDAPSVPMETPLAQAIFPFMEDHCELVIAMFETAYTLPH
jgi:hypothetical protein